MRAHVSLVVCSGLFLSACSGSVSDTNVDAFNSKNTSHRNPFAAEINAGSAITLGSTPPDGIASMTGTFNLQAPAGFTGIEEIGGQMDMAANFASGTVAGSMYQFIEIYAGDTARGIDGSGSFSGSVNVDTGSLDDITASGSGAFATSNRNVYNFSATINGDMYRRPNGDLGSAGVMSLNASGSGGSHGFVGVYGVTE